MELEREMCASQHTSKGEQRPGSAAVDGAVVDPRGHAAPSLRERAKAILAWLQCTCDFCLAWAGPLESRDGASAFKRDSAVSTSKRSSIDELNETPAICWGLAARVMDHETASILMQAEKGE